MIEFEVRLFASLKDRAGAERIAIELDDPATVKQLTEALAASYPALKAALPSALVAVNHDFAFPDTPLTAGDEVAPPHRLRREDGVVVLHRPGNAIPSLSSNETC